MGLNQSTSTLPSQYVILLIDLVRGQGHSLEDILQGTDIAVTTLDSMTSRVSAQDFDRLVHNALSLTQSPTLGLQLGSRINMSAHAVIGQAFMACQTLAQVLDIFMRYSSLLLPAERLHLHKGEDTTSLSLEPAPGLIPITFSCEVFMAAVLNTLRGLLYNHALAVQLFFPYPCPDYRAHYVTAFGRRIEFDADSARISFASANLAHELPTANPALLSLYETQCNSMLSDLKENHTVSEKVRRLLQQLQGQYPSLPQTAHMLHLGPRTLRRRLADESISYQQILDEVRARHARDYLVNSTLPLNSIAYAVGFNDASNFRRAYQRWTGETPTQTRRARNG